MEMIVIYSVTKPTISLYFFGYFGNSLITRTLLRLWNMRSRYPALSS